MQAHLLIEKRVPVKNGALPSLPSEADQPAALRYQVPSGTTRCCTHDSSSSWQTRYSCAKKPVLWASSSGTKEGRPQATLGRPEKASQIPADFGERAVSPRRLR